MATDYTKEGSEILIDLIHEANPGNPLTQHITSSVVTFSNPAVVAAGYSGPAHLNRQTKLNLVAVPGSGFQSVRDVFYDRLAVRDVFATDDPEIVEFPVAKDAFTLTGETNFEDLTDQIFDRYGIILHPEDYYDVTFPAFEGENAEGALVRLEAKGNSKLFIGGVLVQIKPETVPLAVAIPNNELNGLIYDAPLAGYVKLNNLLTQMAVPGYW